MQLEFCTPESGHGLLTTLNFPKIRIACIEACLYAVVEDREFTYTDLFL